MKKKLVFAIIALAFGMSACGKKEPEAIDAIVTPTEAEVEEVTPTEAPLPTVDQGAAQESLDALFDSVAEATPTEAEEEEDSRYGRYTGKIVLDHDRLVANHSFSDLTMDGKAKISFWVSVILEKEDPAQSNGGYDLLVIDPDLMDGYQQAIDLMAKSNAANLTVPGISNEDLAKSAGYASYDDMIQYTVERQKEWWLAPIDETNPNPIQVWPKVYRVKVLEDAIVDEWGQPILTIEKDGSLTGVIDSGVNRFSENLEYNVVL